MVDPSRVATEPSRAQNSGPDELEIRRRRLAALQAQIKAGTLSRESAARIVAEARELQRQYFKDAERAAEARELAERERLRPKHARGYSAHRTNPFDPGAPPASHAREEASCSSNSGEASEGSCSPEKPKRARRKLRPWKAQRRKPHSQLSEKVLCFGTERAWTPGRKQKLAIRVKRNDAIIGHPSSAEAALNKLCPWARASVLRCCRGEGWTLADEAARRHVAWWATLEDFSVPRAWKRPRPQPGKGPKRAFAGGIPKFAMCVVGWTQTAIAIATTGAAYSCGGADPIDEKTVQRHTAYAEKYGGVHVVRRNPDAPAELRGAPTEANPKGWSINEYWLPAPQFAPKPGFQASTDVVSFGVDGTPVDLLEALAIELTPRPKWRRRKLLEQQQAAPPPPL